MGKPWEKYAKSEDKGPWDTYVQTTASNKKLDSTMSQTVLDAAPKLGRLGAHGASFGWSDEMVGALTPGVPYEEARDAERAKLAGYKGEYPFLGPIAEGAGSAATSMVVPGLKGGHWVKEAGLAILEGAGENVDPERLAGDMAVSVGTSLATNAGVGTLKKMVSKPENILANSAGARGINYRNGEPDLGEDLPEEISKRIKDPEGLAARLDKLGFFNMGKKEWKNGKFSRNSFLKLEENLEPASLEEMQRRVRNGVDSLLKENNDHLKGKTIPVGKVFAALQTAADELIPQGEDYLKRSQVARDLVVRGIQDLELNGALKKGSQYINAADVAKYLKSNWQKKVASTYDSGKAVSDITNEGVQFRRKFATAIDKLVDQYGGEVYAKNNDIVSDLLSVQKMIQNKQARLKGYSMGGPRLTNAPSGNLAMHMINSFLENTVAHPQADLVRARIGQGLRTVPGQFIEKTISRTPMEGAIDATIKQDSEIQVPYRPNQTSIPNIPEQFIRTPLPRSTDGLMKNKNFVLGKVAQMMPEMFEAVKDTYDHEPERIGELAQVLAMKMPHVFERDKYNRFDGRILAEKDKQLAIKDTLLRQDISPIAQAKIITKLNKEGTFEG